MSFWSRDIILVTGKGGVGKSLIASSIALGEAQKGRRTLLVEFGDKSFYGHFFGLENVSYEPTQVTGSLWVSRWDSEHCLREYVLHYIRVKALIDLFFGQKVTRALINAAPTLPEISLLGKLTSRQRKVGPAFPFDCVVVDSFATGHTLSLLRAPRGIAEVIKYGPLGEQSREMFQIMCDPKHCEYVIVTQPDELPTVECLELHKIFREEFKIEAAIACNRILQLPQVVKPELGHPMDSAEFSEYLKYRDVVTERQSQNLEKLKATGATVWTIPQFFISESGLPMSRLALSYLEAPWITS